MAGTENENRDTCKMIAEEIEAYQEKRMYRCPECGEIIKIDEDDVDEEENTYVCTNCDTKSDFDDYEQLSIYDYFTETDVFDIEYRINGYKEYQSVELMIACGGPAIFIDTGNREVRLTWWLDKADYPLSTEVCNAIDEYYEEQFSA